MLTGVEIAGLVLAVIPIFISAAEHLQGSTKSRKAIKDGVFARSLQVKLTEQQTLLGLYLKGVLGRTNLPPRLQAQLVDGTDCDIWERPEVAQALASELGDAHQPFVELLRKVSSTLLRVLDTQSVADSADDDIAKILKELCLESKKLSNSAEKQSGLWRRIKLSFKSKEGRAILFELEECNLMLERLSRAAYQAKPYEKAQEARRAHATFQQREQAERLFNILKKACKCETVEPRDVALRLEVTALDDDGALESKFQMLLFDSQHAICELSARITRSDGPEPPKKRLCRSSSSSMSGNTTNDLQTKHMKLLGEICNEVKLAKASNAGLQLYVDNKQDVYSQQQKSSLSQELGQPDLVSLTAVMSRLQLYEGKKWLHREKSILAVTLAYSLLRLYDSPWLQTLWDSNSISFIDETCGHATERFKLGRPFTRSQVTASKQCQPQCPTSNIHPPPPPKPTRRNAHLHALGIVLLELYLNRSIDPDVTAQIATYSHADYRGVAIDLLEEHCDDMAMTGEYHRAIQFCLSPHPNPYSGSFSFEDQGFREIFYNEVIVKLEDNLRSRFEIDGGFGVGFGNGGGFGGGIIVGGAGEG